MSELPLIPLLIQVWPGLSTNRGTALRPRGAQLFTPADENVRHPTQSSLARPGQSASIGPTVMTAHGLITPTHRSIRKYYENVEALRAQGVLNEMSVRSPFESLLQETARLKDWTFIAELSGKSGGAITRPDGTLRDRNSLPRGYWEAKDTQDDLDTEIKKKIGRGYPLPNIIFEDTQTGRVSSLLLGSRPIGRFGSRGPDPTSSGIEFAGVQDRNGYAT